jgi:hypothetical protein
MSNRHQRRSDLAMMRETGVLWTFLIAPNDARLRSAPLLRQTADRWLDQTLRRNVRHCILCASWLVDRGHVGLILLATPASARPSAASCAGICRECTDADLPMQAIEQAAAKVLGMAIPGGRFEPLP